MIVTGVPIMTFVFNSQFVSHGLSIVIGSEYEQQIYELDTIIEHPLFIFLLIYIL